MGARLAKFFRKEKTTAELLDSLEAKVQQIEKFSYNTQEQQKKFVGNFLAISIGIYVLAFIIFYFVYFPQTWKARIIYSVPMLLFPFVIIFLRKLFAWYFQRKLNKTSYQLEKLRAEKKKILEQVMDTETYKVAVNLLTRYGDKTSKDNPFQYKSSLGLSPQIKSLATLSNKPSMRSFTSGTPNSLNTSGPITPIQALTPLSRHVSSTPISRTGQELRRRTPFPIVNQQEKGVFERIMDALVGDGPQDRFAMICKECFAHNGMALKEEFDYLTFRCAFCNALNPSRKARPVAPRLPIQQSRLGSLSIGALHSSESSTSDDSDMEKIDNQKVPRIERTEYNFNATTEKQESDTSDSGMNAASERKKNGEINTQPIERKVSLKDD